MSTNRVEPPAEAIAALGQFMTEWGHLENLVDEVFDKIPPRASDRAIMTFHRLSIKLKTELILELVEIALGDEKITEETAVELVPLIEACDAATKHRNKIVHSVWGRPIRNFFGPPGPWCRIYYHSILEPYNRFTSTDPKDQKFRDRNIYPVARIERLTIELQSLSNKLAKTIDRLEPPPSWLPDKPQ